MEGFGGVGAVKGRVPEGISEPPAEAKLCENVMLELDIIIMAAGLRLSWCIMDFSPVCYTILS